MRRFMLIVAFAAVLPLAGPVLAMGGLTTAAPATDLADAKRLIDKSEYRGAIAKLNAVVAKEPQNADAHNYLGFSHRKLKEYAEAGRSYQAALAIDPAHKGALEYQGELLVETGDLPSAERNLATLATLCPAGCEERAALAVAIEKAKSGKSS